MRKIIPIIAIAFALASCKHEKAVFKSPELLEAENAVAKVSNTQGACDCLTSSQIAACTGNATQAGIINAYTNNTGNITKTVTWANCQTSGGTVNDPNCNYPYTNVTSQIQICFNSCTQATVKITNKPPCLPCYPKDFCMVCSASQQTIGGNVYYVLTGSTAVNDNVQIKLYISSDPDVTVQCAVGPAGNQIIYICYGSY